MFNRMSKGKMLTNVQRQAVSDFLIAITSEVPPGMLLKLLRQLTVDLAKLNEYSNVALRVSQVPQVMCKTRFRTFVRVVTETMKKEKLICINSLPF